jgi:hypothetical protein
VRRCSWYYASGEDFQPFKEHHAALIEVLSTLSLCMVGLMMAQSAFCEGYTTRVFPQRVELDGAAVVIRNEV